MFVVDIVSFTDKIISLVKTIISRKPKVCAKYLSGVELNPLTLFNSYQQAIQHCCVFVTHLKVFTYVMTMYKREQIQTQSNKLAGAHTLDFDYDVKRNRRQLTVHSWATIHSCSQYMDYLAKLIFTFLPSDIFSE